MHDFEQFDHYELLGIPRSASAEEIKRAYRNEMATYHPDKWSKADAARQEYARKRASAITEAYSAIKDFGQRTAPPDPAARPDRLARLYDQGRQFLADGNPAQAISMFQQIQQGDPFYRDSAELLAQAQQDLKKPAGPAKKTAGGSRRMLIALAGGLGVLGIVAAIWLFGGTEASGGDNPTPPIAVVPNPSAQATSGPATSTPAAPTSVAVVNTPAAQPTATSVPPTATSVPPTATSVPPTATSVPPTATSLPPTATSLPNSNLAGPVIAADNMDGGTWSSASTANWSLSFASGRYHMTMQPGVGALWSYASGLPAQNIVLAADVTAVAGSAGLLFGFTDPNNYYRYVVSGNGAWTLQQRSAGRLITLLAGRGLGSGQLSVAQRDRTTRLYWNNAYVSEIVLPAFPAGSYGFILAGNGAAEGYFDNFRLRQLP